MQINKLKSQQAIKFTSEIEFAPVGYGYNVFKMTQKSSKPVSDEKSFMPKIHVPKSSSDRGLITDEELEKLKNGLKYKKVEGAVLLSEVGVKLMRENFRRDFSGYGNIHNADVSLDLLNGLASGQFSDSDLFISSEDGNILVPISGDKTRMIIRPIVFNYIYARFRSEVYDLDKVYEILSKRDDIVLIDPNGVSLSPAKNKDKAIGLVPHYNQDVDGECHMAFLWKPTLEDYERVMVALEEGKSDTGRGYSSDIFRVVFELDVFGLRAGGAALYNDFFCQDKIRTAMGPR